MRPAYRRRVHFGRLRPALVLSFGLVFPLPSVPAVPGDPDPTFDASADNSVFAIAAIPDDRMLVGGAFRLLREAPRNRLALVHIDGTVDEAFAPGLNRSVYCCALQLDGKILIGGDFTGLFTSLFDTTPRHRIARLHSNGSLDEGFNPDLNGEIYDMAVQPDRKIIIAGIFTTVGGTPAGYLARLHSDGTLDTNFHPPEPNQRILSIALQDDGKLIIAGIFRTLGGVTRNRIARLNPDGTLDPLFNPDVGPNLNSQVSTVAVQADGKILIGGNIFRVGGAPRSDVARLYPDGSVDPEFNPGVSGGDVVQSIAVQTDGKILIAGFFTNVNDIPRSNLARLRADGTLDEDFNAGANRIEPDGMSGRIRGLALQQDGGVVIGGEFTVVGGLARQKIARLENGAATQSLTLLNASRIEWLRGGTSPEAEQAAFDLSTDGGSTWMPLGPGTRRAGGWQVDGLSLPRSGQLRARALTSGGEYNGSTGLVEAVATFTVGTDDPFEITNITYETGALFISVRSVSGQMHTLWQSDTGVEGSWHDSGRPAMTGTGAVLTFSVPAPSPGSRFFRVRAAR